MWIEVTSFRGEKALINTAHYCAVRPPTHTEREDEVGCIFTPVNPELVDISVKDSYDIIKRTIIGR